MNRRTFMALLSSSPILRSGTRGTAAQETTPTSLDRPAPVDLGDGITLIDYRMYPAFPYNRIIGEIRNTTSRMIDAPIVSLYYPVDEGVRPVFAYAPPMIPVVEAGGTVPIFGTLPDATDPEEALASAEFALCTQAEPGEYTAREDELALELHITKEQIEQTQYYCEGELTNIGKETAEDVAIHSILRDAAGRVAGTSIPVIWGSIAAGQTVPCNIWVPDWAPHKANPYVLISNADYTAELRAGTQGPIVLPSCSFGTPWD